MNINRCGVGYCVILPITLLFFANSLIAGELTQTIGSMEPSSEKHIIVSKNIGKEVGFNYRVAVEFQGDDLENPRRSALVLFEDGIPLGPAHSLHDKIRETGGGHFSHWDRTVYFSTSDNSDPRTNGKIYTFRWISWASDPGLMSIKVFQGIFYKVKPQLFLLAFVTLLGGLFLERLRPAERKQPIKRLIFNFEYTLLYLLVGAVIGPTLSILTASAAKALGGGWIHIPVPSNMEIISAIIVVGFVVFVRDFFYYWVHRLQHVWPILWAQHKFHHSEKSLNVTTSWRHHWLEYFLLGTGVSFPVALFFDLPPVTVGFVSHLFGLWGYFIHMNIRWDFGKLTPIFAGPQYHRLHHSNLAKHQDINLAGRFPVFDKLFGTYCEPEPGEYPTTGLIDGANMDNLLIANFEVFRDWMSKFSKWTSRPSKKVKILIFLVFLFGGLEVTGYALFSTLKNAAHEPNFTLQPPRATALDGYTTTYFTEIEPWGIWHTPSVSIQHKSKCFDVTYQTNSVGARDDEWPISTQQIRFVALGDSFLEGYGVEKADRMSDVVERLLNVQILNFGSSGNMGPLQYQIIYQKLAQNYSHDGVLVFLLPENDFTDNSWEIWQKNEKPGQTRYRPYYEKCGNKAYCTAYKTETPKSNRTIYQTKDFINLTLTEKLKYLFYNYTWTSVIWAQIDNIISPEFFVTKNFSGYMVQPDGMLDAVQQSLAKISEAANGKPVFLYVIPRPNDFKSVKAHGKEMALFTMLDELKKLHTNFYYADLAPGMMKFESNVSELFLQCDGHWSVKGNNIAAKIVANRVKNKLGHIFK